MRVEICVTSAASARAAQQGGADRVELCRDLTVGGLTPAEDVLRETCRSLQIPVHVLIRPRAGDFVSTDRELSLMISDIQRAKRQGAGGVVFGVLNRDRAIDRDRTAQLVASARPMSVTFHKAFDETRDPFEALEHLVDLGIDRVLTSGQAPTALEGLDRLASLTQRATGRLIIMAGGRIRAGELPALAQAGLAEIHLASGVLTTTDEVSSGEAQVDATKVAAVMNLARSLTLPG